MEDSEGDSAALCVVCAEPLTGDRELTEAELGRRSCACPICRQCVERHIQTQVLLRQVFVECPMIECRALYAEHYIKRCLDEELLRKYEQYKAEARNDPSVKTCIHCGEVHRLSIEEWRRAKEGAEDEQHPQHHQQLEVVCSSCHQPWCFRCHGPLHPGAPCDHKASKTDKKSNKWKRHHASKCPKCDTPIQRTEGCNRMACVVCGTAFCYSCGGKIAGGDQGTHTCEVDRSARGRARRTVEYTVVGSVLAVGLGVALPVCLVVGLVVGGAFGVVFAASAAAQAAAHAGNRVRRRF